MSTLIFNSFSSSQEAPEYPVFTDSRTFSTVDPRKMPIQPIKMEYHLPSAPHNDEVFGKHVREAVSIVREWMHSK